MSRSDLNTLACVNPECQVFKQLGKGNLGVRKVYGAAGLRLLRCRECQEEFSERRGTALFNPKIAEDKAVAIIEHLAVIEHLNEGNSLTPLPAW